MLVDDMTQWVSRILRASGDARKRGFRARAEEAADVALAGAFPQINLSANVGTGTTPVRVSVDTTGVGPGSYQAAILVRTPSGPVAGSRIIPVLVQVARATAVLQTPRPG